jgi:hypothetical protein
MNLPPGRPEKAYGRGDWPGRRGSGAVHVDGDRKQRRKEEQPCTSCLAARWSNVNSIQISEATDDV